MGDSNKSNKNIIGVIGAITSVATVVTPLIDKAIDNRQKQSLEKSEEKVVIPALYDKGFPLELEQAVELLSSYGLKCVPSKFSLKDADIKYRNCFNNQVMDSNPKHKKQVKIGSIVYVKYITDDVIKESQRIFDDMELSRIEKKEKKVIEKTERKERTKEKVASITDKTKQGIEKITHYRKNKQDNQ